MDLPTYTNIWRIEKRLYKLYDFRLPAPLPITWIGVFVGITVPYVLFLIAVGLPFNHNLVWLYVLPPGVLTWLTTRPVIESKRLPELVSSQLRYIAEPRTWCRMAPFSEKDEIMVSARVWHRHPPKARPEKARRSPAKARPGAPVLPGVAEESAQVAEPSPQVAEPSPQVAGGSPQVAEESPRVKVRPAKVRRAVAKPPASARRMASPPVASPPSEPAAPSATAQLPVPERSPSHPVTKRANAQPAARLSWSPWPHGSEPDTSSADSAAEQDPETSQRPAWMVSPRPAEAPDPRTLEVAHDSDPGPRDLSEPHAAPFVPAAWPSPEANLLPLIRPVPAPDPFPEAGPFPEVPPFAEDGPFAEDSPSPAEGPFPEARRGLVPDTARAPDPDPGAQAEPGPQTEPGTQTEASSAPAADTEQGEAAPQVWAASAASAAVAASTMTPAWPQAPEPPSKPRPRWMLRVRPRPAAAPILNRPVPAEPQPATLPPAPLMPGELAALEAPAPMVAAPVAPVPGIVLPELLVPAAEAPAPEAPAAEAPAPEAPAPETPAPEAPAAAAPIPAPEPSAPDAPEPSAPDAPELSAPELSAPELPAPPASAPVVAARFVGVERERPVPSIERAVSGPGSRGEVSWRRQVKVVAGGQGPGKRDQEALDRDRARLPLAGPLLIAVLGCTRGAGQTVTTLMTAHILAAVRGIPVAALDLNPGATSLAVRRAPAVSLQRLLAGQQPGHPGHPGHPGPGHSGQRPGRGQGARLDVIADLRGNDAAHPLDGDGYQRLADLLAERYPLTLIDPAPAGLTRVLSAADQLLLVAPASPDAATSLANTQQWLGAHGYGELAARAVTLVNGVSRRTMEDVLRAESVARGRCRAIVRVPWDDHLSAADRPPGEVLHPQTRLAYTALAGVLVAGLAAASGGPVPGNSPVPGRNPGERAD